MLTQSPQSEPTWQAILHLLRWDKPAGRLILMIPALWAVVLAAEGRPPLVLLGVIVLGSLATSAAGCVVNDLWDRKIDAQVSRTRHRPLAAKALSVKVGLGVAAVAFACAWGLAAYLNPLSFWLAVAAVPFIVLYPLAKRVFPMPQLVMALCWGFTVLISWSAVTASLSFPTWLLWGATLFWALGFDTVYAMADRLDDERIGVNSSARFFGKFAPTAVALCFMASALLLAGVGEALSLSWPFWLALVLVTAGWGWQSLQLRAAQPDPQLYGQIFRQNVGLGFLLLIGMELGSLS
ncbi:MAG: 4-hydroxybenzoate solanesyltransferase [Pegethrix bostrychoides GSE-TBD4-15B]|jgi:4-hydroxybenzoate polyprenyltransferase|uniref:4-hydroxybenzoate solanesyltransferase n=1 Tax=Pegethrix bostrychoides GSE-TBD4-15B TaxID=2839662 RepID=A0A951PDK9_9CYAN|nr:4-hydroxybenzoate solanesyltransferase [Pegethrix bostrychoides GSE-TBD4-15B]